MQEIINPFKLLVHVASLSVSFERLRGDGFRVIILRCIRNLNCMNGSPDKQLDVKEFLPSSLEDGSRAVVDPNDQYYATRREAIFDRSSRGFVPNLVDSQLKDVLQADPSPCIGDKSRFINIANVGGSSSSYGDESAPNCLLAVSGDAFAFCNGVGHSRSRSHVSDVSSSDFESGTASMSRFSLKPVESAGEKVLEVSFSENFRSASESGFKALDVSEDNIGDAKDAAKDFLFGRVARGPADLLRDVGSEHLARADILDNLQPEFKNQETDYRILAAARALLEIAKHDGYQKVVFDAKDDLRLFMVLKSVGEDIDVRCSDRVRAIVSELEKKRKDSSLSSRLTERLIKSSAVFLDLTSELNKEADGFTDELLSRSFAAPVATVAKEMGSKVSSAVEVGLYGFKKDALDLMISAGDKGVSVGDLMRLFNNSSESRTLPNAISSMFPTMLGDLVSRGLAEQVVGKNTRYFAKQFVPKAS